MATSTFCTNCKIVYGYNITALYLLLPDTYNLQTLGLMFGNIFYIGNNYFGYISALQTFCLAVWPQLLT